MPKHYARRVRRKVTQDGREEAIANTNARDTDSNTLQGSDVDMFQHGIHTPDSILRMQNTIGNAAVQRLMDYKTYKKQTKAPGKRSHIRGLDKAYKLYMQHEPSMTGGQKVSKLMELIKLADAYLADPKRQKSKRRNGVIALKQELQNELNGLKSDLTGDEFSDENVTANRGEFGSGQMSSVDLFEYGFGLMQEVDDEGIAHDIKVENDTFEGVFKPDADSFENIGQTRAAWIGMDKDDPRLAQRSVATYELSKLFDASIIPPTFFAMHEKDGEQVMGTVMQKVKGVEARKSRQELKDSAHEQFKTDPVYREGVSKLMMFDFITGQVDRHKGNYMVELEDGVIKGVKGIDNDLSFGDLFTDMTYTNPEDKAKGRDNSQTPARYFQHIAGDRIQDLEEIDMKLAQRIIEVSNRPELVQNALDGLLKDSEIDATLSRLNSLADFLQQLINANDDRLIAKWE